MNHTLDNYGIKCPKPKQTQKEKRIDKRIIHKYDPKKQEIIYKQNGAHKKMELSEEQLMRWLKPLNTNTAIGDIITVTIDKVEPIQERDDLRLFVTLNGIKYKKKLKLNNIPEISDKLGGSTDNWKGHKINYIAREFEDAETGKKVDYFEIVSAEVTK